MTTWADIEYFSPAEFKCRCGECDSTGDEMQMDFVRKLNDLRRRFGFPLVVTSGYRCPDYNERISTTGRDGPHTTGRAVDLHVYGERVHGLFLHMTLGGWMTGIGLHQRGPLATRFIHLDDLGDPHPRPRIWTY